MREFCGVKRNSLRLPFTELFNGTLPKFEPMLEPAFLSRHTEVRSMKPTGIKQVLPKRINAGDCPSGFASQGLVEAVAGAACGIGSGEGVKATGAVGTFRGTIA